MVGFLSQIGWTGDNPNANSTIKIIPMEKIFVDVDTNGGNHVLDRLHNKIPHRECVAEKVCQYLGE